jgi:hypothetical protein
LGKFKWTSIALANQDYVMLPQILKKEKVSVQSGDQVNFNVKVTHGSGARQVQLYEVDVVNVPEYMQVGNVPWRHTNSPWAIDEREIAMNRDPARIVELIKTRRVDALEALAEHAEDQGWAAASDTSDDIYGVRYWINKKITGSSAAASTGEFGGNVPTGHTTVGGLNPTTYPRWKNWTHTYVDVTVADLVTKMRKAFSFTKFKSPVAFPSYERGASRQAIYCGYDELASLEVLAVQQNDQNGNDLASRDGLVTLRGRPIHWVPQLDADSDNPLYFIDWSVFYPVFLGGWSMKESPTIMAPNQHTVQTVHIDMTWNLVCKDRRRNAVLVTAADND